MPAVVPTAAEMKYAGLSEIIRNNLSQKQLNIIWVHTAATLLHMATPVIANRPTSVCMTSQQCHLDTYLRIYWRHT